MLFFLIFLQILSGTFLILRRIQRHIIIKLRWSSSIVTVVFFILN